MSSTRTQPKGHSRYIELLKRALIDHRNIGSVEYHPLQIVDPTWRNAILYPLDSILRSRAFAIGKILPVLKEERMNGEDWPAHALTMIGMKRLDNIEMCIRSIQEENIPGDVMEAGVWRGGAGIFMKAMLDELRMDDRKVWLADSFQGLPRPDVAAFPADADVRLHAHRILRVPLEEVRANFLEYGLLDDRVCFLKGWFQETLPKAPVEQLALLHLDADMYGSTMVALRSLYHKVAPGGFVIVDDYHSIPACRSAVDDFRAANGITAHVHAIDREAVYWRRTE